MKRLMIILSLFLLTTNFSACKNAEHKNEDIHSKIHSKYYTVESYRADCTITVYTSGGENTYECTVGYNKDDSSFKVVSDDMTIDLTDEKTVITKNGNTLESVPSNADMYIFVNTFFKSYYEAEDTTVSVNSSPESNQTLLECSSVNPTEFASHMKLWIDNQNVVPTKMQIYNKKNQLTSEIKFRSFEFC